MNQVTIIYKGQRRRYASFCEAIESRWWVLWFKRLVRVLEAEIDGEEASSE